MTYDGTSLRVYFDGYKVGVTVIGKPRVPGKTVLTFGRRQDGYFTSYYHGQLDDVRIYNRALADDEIKRHYDLPDPKGAPAESGFVRQWKF